MCAHKIHAVHLYLYSPKYTHTIAPPSHAIRSMVHLQCIFEQIMKVCEVSQRPSANLNRLTLADISC